MPVLQLTWDQAGWLSGVLVIAGFVASRSDSTRARTLGPFVREAAVIAALYTLWQLAGTLAEHGTAGGLARGRWIARTERGWHLPSEQSLQGPLLEHRSLGYLANLYYAGMHFPGLIVLLFWVFWRHRAHYRRLRAVVIGFTTLSLLIQLVPVAPPRLVPQLGFTDVAAHYGQSVYALGGLSADELSAVPSVHVGWAVLVGLYPVLIGTSRWRWLTLLHPVATVYVVVATANHWWFDGLVSIALLAAVVLVVRVWTGGSAEDRPAQTPAAVEADSTSPAASCAPTF
ncbi:MAG: phosphatase PAP2 family protein [bacterium]